MVLRQLDELNPALSIMNFEGSHAKGINSGTGRGSRNRSRCESHNQSRFYTQSYQVHENGGIPRRAFSPGQSLQLAHAVIDSPRAIARASWAL